MHSRILGVTPNDYYKEVGGDLKLPLDIYQEELPYFADYVIKPECTSLREDFEWFIECLTYNEQLKDYIVYNNKKLTFSIKQGFKEIYFNEKYEKAKTLLLDYNNFCNKVPYDLENAIDSKYGFYIADEGGSYDTLDNFIRLVDYNKEYKMFDSLDYHF